MRRFEKISFEEFIRGGGFEKLSVERQKEMYKKVVLPTRGTDAAAGYDFSLINNLKIKPGEVKKIATGIKAVFPEDEALFLIVRSSTGFKYDIRLVNQVGVIDADYYNNADNEGHIFYKIKNEGSETREFRAGDKLIQGIFMKYLMVDEDVNQGIGNQNKKRGSNY